jgi:hypothetical protein
MKWWFLVGFLGMAAVEAIWLLAFPAHAAVHADKPTTVTTPIASKQESTCIQSTVIMRFIIDKNGNWHKLPGSVTAIEACHI